MNMFARRLVPVANSRSTIAFRRRNNNCVTLPFYRSSGPLSSSAANAHGIDDGQAKNDYKRSGVRILYASQTGTAQMFAHQLADGLDDEGVDDVTILGLDECPSPSEALEGGKLNLLIASCAGKGEPPDNARNFYEWAVDGNPEDATLPEGVNYAVFGLGNEAAHPNNYNVVGRRFDARLHEMGGRRVLPLGLGDDGGCIEGDFDEWAEEVADMISRTGEQEEDTSVEDVEEQPRAECPPIASSATEEGSANETRPVSKKYPALVLGPAENNVVRRDLFHLTGSDRFYADGTARLEVIYNRLLASDAGESSLHEIRVSAGGGSGSRYETGDHLVVYPRNSEVMTYAYAEMLGVDPHAIIVSDEPECDDEGNGNCDEEDRGSGGSYPHPFGITVAETLSHCVDLGALPSPVLARLILGRRGLDYVQEIAEPRRTVLDLCRQAGTRLSLEDFLYNAAPMKPRYYSIASSNIQNPDEIDLVFRTVNYVTSMGHLRRGVCTSFMEHMGSMRKGSHYIACLPALVSPNPSFRLPGDRQTQLLFIGGGYGLAPLRAFIEERLAHASGGDVGPATLFLGFRNPQDEVYPDLARKALERGALTSCEVVYSSGCESEGDGQQHHQMNVSDLVRLRGNDVWEHVRSGGHVYMCGGARTFGAAIEAALLDVFQEKWDMDFDGALAFLRQLVEEGRLSEDLAN